MPVIRHLSDDTLIVFLSDTHIGGDEGRDIFETPDDLIRMLEFAAEHDGPIELILAGDFFDFLRIANVPPGQNRLVETLSRPEYRDLFAAVRAFAATAGHHVIYLPGNHDAEAWWNHEIRDQIISEGLVHEFALTFAAVFESSPGHVVYCQHGNQFDDTNQIHDYEDPLDTPLGDHVVTQITRPLANRRIASIELNDVDRVFPLGSIPAWAVGRLFYQLMDGAARYLLLPIVLAFFVYETVTYALGREDEFEWLLLDIGYDFVVVLLVFGVFALLIRSAVSRMIHSFSGSTEAPPVDPVLASEGDIRRRLEAGEVMPMDDSAVQGLSVFVSGHTHAPSLGTFARPGGGTGVMVNSGCWLRQLQPVPARLHMPPVFVSRYVQTHVRVFRRDGEIQVELWERPRRAAQNLRWTERAALAGRRPADLDAEAEPRVRDRSAVSDVSLEENPPSTS